MKAGGGSADIGNDDGQFIRLGLLHAVHKDFDDGVLPELDSEIRVLDIDKRLIGSLSGISRSATLQKHSDYIVQSAADPNMTHETRGSMSYPHPWQGSVDWFEKALKAWEGEIGVELMPGIDLTSTPKFDKNHFVAFRGSENVSDDRKRVDYNRAAEMQAKTAKAFGLLAEGLFRERNRIELKMKAHNQEKPLLRKIRP